jgi:hypothetical protein
MCCEGVSLERPGEEPSGRTGMLIGCSSWTIDIRLRIVVILRLIVPCHL